MVRADRPRRLGLLAFAFDGAGRDILDTVMTRPDLEDSLILVHHLITSDGVAAESGDAESVTEWLRRSPGSEWESAPWETDAASVAEAVEEAVKDALDARRWLSAGGGVDLLDLVLIARFGQSDQPALPPGLLPQLHRLRRTYQRIGRVLLLVRRTFETEGEAGVPTRLRPLPYWEEEGASAFDLILLRGPVNCEGLVVRDEEQILASTATILVHLTVGELAPTLFARLQAHAAVLPGTGHYVSVGLAEWRLSKSIATRFLGDALYTQVSAHLADLDGADGRSSSGGAEVSAGSSVSKELSSGPQPSDPWLQSVRDALEAVGQEPAQQLLDAALSDATHGLEVQFRDQRWSLPALRSVLSKRIHSLTGWERDERAELMIFMQRFARSYVKKKARKQDAVPAGASGDLETERVHLDRLVLFVICFLVVLVCGTAAAMSEGGAWGWWWGGGAAAAAVAALLVFLRGLKEVVTEKSEPPLPEPDLLNELSRRRGRLELLEELRSAHHLIDTAQRELTARTPMKENRPKPISEVSFFPFTPEICSALLERRNMNSEEVLRRFWEQGGGLHLFQPGREGSLRDMLKTFAREQSAELSDLTWQDVYSVAGGSEPESEEFWYMALEQVQHAAVPPVPVSGQRDFGLVALPPTLPMELRKRLVQRLPADVERVETEGDGLFVLRVTQGFESFEDFP